MSVLDGSFAESIGAIWWALHRGNELVIHENEIHQLRVMALGADGDLVSHLLLRKLQIAHVANGASIPDSVIALNSFCEFSFDGGEQRFCQLVRPSSYAPSYGLSVLSLAGAGLIGLRAGQTILWPNEAGTLCDLHVARVENRPGLGDRLGSTPEEDRAHV
jgi:regulator of nucleoside diphosphate kinase